MTQTPQSEADKLAEMTQNVLNLQSACTELEAQLKWTSNRAAGMAVERDNAIRYAKMLESQIEALKAAIPASDVHNEEISFVPAPAPRKPGKKSVN